MIAEAINAVTHAPSEWVEWEAGDCPVARLSLVQVQMRFELNMGRDENQLPMRAGFWTSHWTHTGDRLLDIIAYRVVSG